MKITIYTIPNDPYCKQAKDYLTAKGLQFEEKDVQGNKEFLSELLEKSNKFAGVPFSLLEEAGKVVPLKGFTQKEFDDALASLKGDAKPEALGGAAPATGAPADMMPKPTGDMPKPLDMNAQAPKPMDSVGAPDPMSAMPKPMGDMPKADMGMGGQPVVSVPSAPAPVAPMASAPAAPSMPSMGGSMSAPAAPAVSGAPAPVMDPQAELNNILKDLQDKTEPMPAAGASAPAISGAPMGAPAPMGTPPMPSMPTGDASMPQGGQPAAAPTIPDFGKAQ